MERADQIRPGDRNAAAIVDQLTTLAGQLESDASSRSGADQKRLKALAETLRNRAARLK